MGSPFFPILQLHPLTGSCILWGLKPAFWGISFCRWLPLFAMLPFFKRLVFWMGFMPLFKALFGLIFAPRDLFSGQRDAPNPALGFKAMGLLGLGFALLDLWLYFRGHQPTFIGNFIPAKTYYLWQAFFVTPVLWFAFFIYVFLTRLMAGFVGGQGNSRILLANMGMAYGFPVLLGYIIPDLVVFGLYGHYGMSVAMKIYGPICILYTLFMGAFALRISETLSWPKAMIINGIAFFLQALPAAFFIR